MDESGEWVVTRVGAEPVVEVARDEAEPWRDHVTILLPGWAFEQIGSDARAEWDQGGAIGFTVDDVDELDPDLEHGFISLGGHTLDDLRRIVAMERGL